MDSQLDPTALGMVLATLVDATGKPVRGGSVKGQLYVGPAGLTVLRPTRREALVHTVASVALFGSIVAVVANLFTLKNMVLLWSAIAVQALYWLTLPARRGALEPAPLDANALEAARGEGRAAISIPAGSVMRTVAPEPPRTGFRRPARFELAEGALEVFLSQEQFAEASAALERAARR